jgi:hypothetical protein
MGSQLLELGMCAANVTELRRPELGQIGLVSVSIDHETSDITATYVNIKPQDGVLLAGTLQSRQFGLQLVLRHVLSLLRRLLHRVIPA